MNNKEKAIEFLKLIIKGDIHQAFERFVDIHGKHHNINFEAGFSSLKEAMIYNHPLHPNKGFEIIVATSEDNLVTVLAKLVLTDKTYSASYFFKFNEKLIIEMWDSIQEIPPNYVNQDGPF